jgi:hypothetical protein
MADNSESIDHYVCVRVADLKMTSAPSTQTQCEICNEMCWVDKTKLAEAIAAEQLICLRCYERLEKTGQL